MSEPIQAESTPGPKIIASPIPLVQPPFDPDMVMPASIWKRLGNAFIDTLARVGVFILLVLMSRSMTDQSLVVFVISGLIIIFGYELIMESIWQRTLGKFVTGTKVVDIHGKKPSFLKVLGRSAARWIPFEQFSFLVSKHPMGWHDLLSKTLVVDSDISDEKLKTIDIEHIRQNDISNVVVVITTIAVVFFFVLSIIGFFASIVLSSLATARAKGVEVQVQSNMILFKTQSLIYRDTEGSYAGFCKSEEGQNLISAIMNSTTMFTSSDIMCNDSEKSWALSVSKLASDYPGYFCIDDDARAITSTKFNIGVETFCQSETASSDEKVIDIDGMDSERN